MKNTKENILKVLKAKAESYWRIYKYAKDRGNRKEADNYFELYEEINTIIYYFEKPQFFKESADLWL